MVSWLPLVPAAACDGMFSVLEVAGLDVVGPALDVGANGSVVMVPV